MPTAIKLILAATALTAVTGAGYVASSHGWGLPGLLDEPVSIRQESVAGGKRAQYHYFVGHRSHYGGGLHGGK